MDDNVEFKRSTGSVITITVVMILIYGVAYTEVTDQRKKELAASNSTVSQNFSPTQTNTATNANLAKSSTNINSNAAPLPTNANITANKSGNYNSSSSTYPMSNSTATQSRNENSGNYTETKNLKFADPSDEPESKKLELAEKTAEDYIKKNFALCDGSLYVIVYQSGRYISRDGDQDYLIEFPENGWKVISGIERTMDSNTAYAIATDYVNHYVGMIRNKSDGRIERKKISGSKYADFLTLNWRDTYWQITIINGKWVRPTCSQVHEIVDIFYG